MTHRLMTVAMVATLALSACAGGSKVGDESLLDFEGKGAGDRLGRFEESPKPKAKKAKKRTAPSPAATQAPKVVAKVWEVSITAEGFDPFNFRVFKGDEIKVTNADTMERSFKAINGAFDSGLLAPGKSWTYVAKKLGVFELEDATRPFVVGKLEVIARS